MDLIEILEGMRQAVLDGDAARAAGLAEEAARMDLDPARCIEDGFVAGIREVGRLWEQGEYFLPELVQGADAVKAGMDVLRPGLLERAGGAPADGRIALGTVQGDIHDIGKSLVATMLEANGFQVLDLGRDVPDERFVEAAREEGIRILGLSALLTTTMEIQARVIRRLAEEGVRDRVLVMVGGAPVTRSFAVEAGADGFAANAMQAVAEVRRLLGEGGP